MLGTEFEKAVKKNNVLLEIMLNHIREHKQNIENKISTNLHSPERMMSPGVTVKGTRTKNFILGWGAESRGSPVGE